MSELYEMYLELESQLLELQKKNPLSPATDLEEKLCDKMDVIWYALEKDYLERLTKTENELSDQLADIWYDLNDTERTTIKQKHLEKTTK